MNVCPSCADSRCFQDTCAKLDLVLYNQATLEQSLKQANDFLDSARKNEGDLNNMWSDQDDAIKASVNRGDAIKNLHDPA